MYKFDVVNYKWTIGPPFNIPRYNAACKYVANQLFIFGGLTESSVYSGTSVVEMLNSPSSANEDSKWQMINYTGPMNDANMIGTVAIYPVKMQSQMIIGSNTIFIMGFYSQVDDFIIVLGSISEHIKVQIVHSLQFQLIVHHLLIVIWVLHINIECISLVVIILLYLKQQI